MTLQQELSGLKTGKRPQLIYWRKCTGLSLKFFRSSSLPSSSITSGLSALESNREPRNEVVEEHLRCIVDFQMVHPPPKCQILIEI